MVAKIAWSNYFTPNPNSFFLFGRCSFWKTKNFLFFSSSVARPPVAHSSHFHLNSEIPSSSNSLYPRRTLKKKRYFAVKHCTCCDTTWNRDINAAWNIRGIFLHMYANGGKRPKLFQRLQKEATVANQQEPSAISSQSSLQATEDNGRMDVDVAPETSPSCPIQGA